jgi:predicted DNA-binding protein (UPF0251 family)
MTKITSVPGYPGYAASEDGRVWSKWIRGKTRIGVKWRVLKPQRSNKDHRQVTLCRDGEKHQWPVHQIILLTFVGPLPERQETRHLNGIPYDNRLENLCYGTQEENAQDAIEHGTTSRGEQHGRSKLSEEEAKEIIRLRAEEGIRGIDLAERFGVSTSLVSMILKGKIWTHLNRPEKYVPRQRVIQTQSAKITEEQVREIRLLHKEGWTQPDLAKKYGIVPSAISHIITGRAWVHVT